MSIFTAGVIIYAVYHLRCWKRGFIVTCVYGICPNRLAREHLLRLQCSLKWPSWEQLTSQQVCPPHPPTHLLMHRTASDWRVFVPHVSTQTQVWHIRGDLFDSVCMCGGDMSQQVRYSLGTHCSDPGPPPGPYCGDKPGIVYHEVKNVRTLTRSRGSEVRTVEVKLPYASLHFHCFIKAIKRDPNIGLESDQQ